MQQFIKKRENVIYKEKGSTNSDMFRTFTIISDTLSNTSEMMYKPEDISLYLLLENELFKMKTSFYKFFWSSKKTELGQSIQIVDINPQIIKKTEGNKFYRKLIDFILKEIQNNPFVKECDYYIKCFIHKDIEIPEWEETVISINISELDFSSKLKLWRLVEEDIQNKLVTIKNQNLKKLLKNIAIEVK